jgi:hypothetical protein
LIDAVKQPASIKDFDRFLKDSLPVFRSQYVALSKLSPPATLRYLHLKALKAEQQQLAGIQAAITKMDSGADPRKTYDAMDKQLSPISDAETAAWKKLRIPACASI